MVYIPKEIMDLIKPGEEQQEIVKVLATADENGNPHAIILGSLMAIDEETLAFGVVWTKNTKENLEKTKKAAIIVYKPPMTAYRIHGTFSEYLVSGPLVDRYNDELKKFNLSCQGVVKLKFEEAYTAGPPSPGQKITC